ncbi:28793_t:CDS:1, partial [Racocetra persica]
SSVIMPDASHSETYKSNLVPVTFKWSQWGSNVQVAGSFDSPYTPWNPISMTKSDGSSDFVVTLDLKPNATYYYKFVVDGQWVLDNNVPSHPDSSGNYNHEVEVASPSPTSAKCDDELEDGNDNNDNIANEKNIEQDTTH